MAHFIGTPQTEWVDDDREMKLLNSIIFWDDNGIAWTAEAGLVFDGASVPRFLWRFIGSPFTGKYRRSAIIHDAYYKRATAKREKVDQMFFEAMIADGVSHWRAWMMYKAVRMFGGSSYGQKKASVSEENRG